MKTKILTIVILISVNTFGQIKEDIKYYTYNTLFGGITGGIGSAIHKKENEKISHAFINGFWKGCIGGNINYISKLTLKQITLKENYWYGLESKLINSIGNSIIHNATLNQKIYQEYTINLGFINYTTNFKNNTFQINPITSCIFIYDLINNQYKLNIKKTIKTGTIIFDNITVDKNKIHGRCNNNIIITQKENKRQGHITIHGITYLHYFTEYDVIAHELTHSFQFEEYFNINNFPKINHYKFINFDIPYENIFYYLFKDFFENEADYFSLIPY